jgi:hypothetical protein
LLLLQTVDATIGNIKSERVVHHLPFSFPLLPPPSARHIDYTMRLTHTFICASLSFLQLTSALHSHALRHKPRQNPVSIARRQYHAPRALLDVCAYLDLDLGIELDLLGIDLNNPLHIQLCLCLSALPLYLDITTDVSLLTAIGILGKDEVLVRLRSIVRFIFSRCSCSDFMFPARFRIHPTAMTASTLLTRGRFVRPMMSAALSVNFPSFETGPIARAMHRTMSAMVDAVSSLRCV